MTRHLTRVAPPEGRAPSVDGALLHVEGGIASPRAALRARLDELFTQHSPYVARLAHRMMGRDSEVDDIVQDVFVQLLRHVEQIRHPDAVGAWLETTTVRMIRRRLRMRRIVLLLGLGEVDTEEVIDGGCSPEDRAAFKAVYAVLDTLGVNVRIAWILRYLEQERIEDVAQLCKCSTRTAKRWIARAQVAVKGALGQ